MYLVEMELPPSQPEVNRQVGTRKGGWANVLRGPVLQTDKLMENT
jgi:hypothetical protein